MTQDFPHPILTILGDIVEVAVECNGLTCGGQLRFRDFGAVEFGAPQKTVSAGKLERLLVVEVGHTLFVCVKTIIIRISVEQTSPMWCSEAISGGVWVGQEKTPMSRSTAKRSLTKLDKENRGHCNLEFCWKNFCNSRKSRDKLVQPRFKSNY